MGNCSRTEMNEVFQRNKRAGRAGIDWCLCPSCKARQFVFFSSPALVDAEGGEETLRPQLAVGMLVHCPNQLHQRPGDQLHDRTPSPSVRTAGIKSCGDKKKQKKKTVLGLCIRVYEFILCTNKVHSSELLAPCPYASVKIKRQSEVSLQLDTN